MLNSTPVLILIKELHVSKFVQNTNFVNNAATTMKLLTMSL